MYLISDFSEEQPQKPKRDYSWIVPTAMGIGTLAAIGVGLAGGRKDVKARTAAKAEKAAKTVKKTKATLAQAPVVTLDDIQAKPSVQQPPRQPKPLKSAKPTAEKKAQPQPTIEKKVVQKSDAKPMPKGLDPIEKTIEIKRRKLKLKNNPATVQEVYQYTRQGGQNIAPSKRSALTQADIERRQDAVNKMIAVNNGDYNAVHLLTDFAYKDPDWIKVLNKWRSKAANSFDDNIDDRLDIIDRLRGVANKAQYDKTKPNLEFLKKKYTDKSGKKRRVVTGITSIYRESPRTVDVDLLVGNPKSLDDDRFKGALDSLDKKIGTRKVIIQGVNDDIQKIYKKKFGDRMP